MFLLPLKIIVLCTTLFLILHTLLNLLSPRGGGGGGGGNWKHFKGKQSTFAEPTFILNIYFHDVSLKNCSMLYAKQNKSGTENSNSSLKQGREMSSFCLKQAWFEGLGGTALSRLPFISAPLPPPGSQCPAI